MLRSLLTAVGLNVLLPELESRDSFRLSFVHFFLCDPQQWCQIAMVGTMWRKHHRLTPNQWYKLQMSVERDINEVECRRRDKMLWVKMRLHHGDLRLWGVKHVLGSLGLNSRSQMIVMWVSSQVQLWMNRDSGRERYQKAPLYTPTGNQRVFTLTAILCVTENVRLQMVSRMQRFFTRFVVAPVLWRSPKIASWWWTQILLCIEAANVSDSFTLITQCAFHRIGCVATAWGIDRPFHIDTNHTGDVNFLVSIWFQQFLPRESSIRDRKNRFSAVTTLRCEVQVCFLECSYGTYREGTYEIEATTKFCMIVELLWSRNSICSNSLDKWIFGSRNTNIYKRPFSPLEFLAPARHRSVRFIKLYSTEIWEKIIGWSLHLAAVLFSAW